MYHAIVRRRLRRLFDAINQGDSRPVLRALARNFEHVFLGDTALGGRRKTLAATRDWYDRLYQLLPDIHFDLCSILVSGSPWNTLVIVEWNERNTGTDGVLTTNHGIHALRLRWGRITHLYICPDTVALKATLNRLAIKGVAQAQMPPIEG